jgi:hypothetical protein
MNLKKAAILAIIGVSYIFASRTIGTLAPGVFQNLLATQINVILSILASLTFVYFYVLFLIKYLQPDQIRLKRATVFAIIGSAAISLLLLKGLFLVFGFIRVNLYEVSPNLIDMIRTSSIEPVIPLLSSIFMLFFFAIFHQEIRRSGESALKTATLLAAIGTAISMALQAFTFVNFIFQGQVKWLSEFPTKMAIILLPLIVFSAFASLYFYIAFYKAQR